MRQKLGFVSILNRAIRGDTGFFLFLLLVGRAIGQQPDSYFPPLKSVRTAPFSASGDGVSNDRSAFQMALTSGMSIYVPAGVYLIDNSSGPLVIPEFSSTLEF